MQGVLNRDGLPAYLPLQGLQVPLGEDRIKNCATDADCLQGISGATCEAKELIKNLPGKHCLTPHVH